MKLKASIQMPEEERDLRDLKACYPGAKVHESDACPPQKVLFVTTKKGRKHGMS